MKAPTPYHCGRMDDHRRHQWKSRFFLRQWYTCSGRRIHEGGWRGFSVRVNEAAVQR